VLYSVTHWVLFNFVVCPSSDLGLPPSQPDEIPKIRGSHQGTHNSPYMLILVSFFYKISVWYKKNSSNNEKKKIIKRIIFALFLLQKIKFGEMRIKFCIFDILNFLFLLKYFILLTCYSRIHNIIQIKVNETLNKKIIYNINTLFNKRK